MTKGATEMTRFADSFLCETRDKIRAFAQAHQIRPNWHEPDEQEVKAEVVGNHLDNAGGDDVYDDAIEQGWQEFVVRLSGPHGSIDVNLASLLAIAAQS
jgi:hypothetical protein